MLLEHPSWHVGHLIIGVHETELCRPVLARSFVGLYRLLPSNLLLLRIQELSSKVLIDIVLLVCTLPSGSLQL